MQNYDGVSVTESWLNENFSSSEIFDESYNVFRSDRTVEKYNLLKVNRPDLPPDENVLGGGCLIALKKNISALRMSDWEKETLFDNVWLKINTHGNNEIFINTIYIPGWAGYQDIFRITF